LVEQVFTHSLCEKRTLSCFFWSYKIMNINDCFFLYSQSQILFLLASWRNNQIQIEHCFLTHQYETQHCLGTDPTWGFLLVYFAGDQTLSHCISSHVMRQYSSTMLLT
jgi:hypothetical protein